MRIMLSIT